MLAGVEGHTGTARVLRMTCRKWVVKPVGAVTSRIWRVGGELVRAEVVAMEECISVLGDLHDKPLPRFVPNHAYIAPAGKISPAATKLRPVFQIPWSGRPPPRAGRTAARFGAQLTARTARHPVCGEPFLPPNFRRRVAGVPPVRREALRVVRFQFQSGRRENARISRQFQFKTFGTLPNLCLPENKRGEAESYTKVHFSE